MSTTRRTRRSAARTSVLTPDLALFGGLATLSAVLALMAVPVLSAVAGVVLLIVVQGVAGTAAILPVGAARRGFTAIAALVGVLLTIVQGVLANLLGFPLTRPTIVAVAYGFSILLLLVAGLRNTVPAVVLDTGTAVPAVMLLGGTALAVVVAVRAGADVPRFAPEPFSSVAFADSLATVAGVVDQPVGRALPVAITITNQESGPVSYRVSWTADPAAAVPVTTVTVPQGKQQRVTLPQVQVKDGCLHRFLVTVRGKSTYQLTLYVRGTGAACPT